MCTAINFNGFFGRTLDYECGFGEEALTLPLGHRFEFRHRRAIESSFAIMGMAKKENGYPLFFDAVNEKGLAMAGLNFVGNAFFPEGRKGSVASFELIPFILSQAQSVREARELLTETEIVNTPFSPDLQPSPLHWMIGDTNESLTVESTKDGLTVCRNPVGVLTNNPPFQYQMMNLNNYINITAKPAVNRFSADFEPVTVSRGMGAIGLPGDWSSSSRFVRAAFVRENAVKERSVAHFFNIMSSVAVPKGCMILESSEIEYTRYISCMDLENGNYYYRRYDDDKINIQRCAPLN